MTTTLARGVEEMPVTRTSGRFGVAAFKTLGAVFTRMMLRKAAAVEFIAEPM